jgi:hypothetical protein
MLWIKMEFSGVLNRRNAIDMRANCGSKCHLLPFWIAILFFGALVVVHAGDKLTVQIRGQTISAWRTVDLESAKQEAAKEHKPIAWIASSPDSLKDGRITSDGSRGATLHAFYALRSQTVLVFEDGFAENHRVLSLVDDAIHTKDGQHNSHPTLPIVVFLNPAATEVIAKVEFEPDFVKRAHLLADALKQAKAKLDGESPPAH